MSINLPPPPTLNGHPLVDDNNVMTRAYSQWFFSVYNILKQAEVSAPASAKYVLNTANALLPNAQVLGSLATGFAKVTIGTGAITTQASIASSDLANTSVTAAGYTVNGGSHFTVNAQGQLTAAANITITTTGTADKITVTGGTGTTPTITIASTYVGQSSITTLGTITTGVWNGTAIANANLANTAVANLSGTNTGDQTTVSGNAGSATTTATTDDTTTNATMYPVWKTATTGNLAGKVSSTKFTFNPSTGMLTTTGVTATFTGNLTGNVTGNCTGSSGSCTGNSATVTTNANLSGDVTSSGNTTTVAKIAGVTVGTPTGTGNVVMSSNVVATSGTCGTCTGNAATVTTNANSTGDVTSVGNVTTVAKIAGVTVGTPTGTTNVVMSASPTLTGTPLAPTATAGTNTTQLATTAFVTTAITNSGAVGTMTGFNAYCSTNQTITSSTFTKVKFDTKDFDLNSDYDAVTNYRWTPTVAGKMYISAYLNASLTVAGALLLVMVYKNGVEVKRGVCSVGTSTQTSSWVSHFVNMNGSTDYIEIYCWQNSGVSTTLNTVTTNTNFSGYRLPGS